MAARLNPKNQLAVREKIRSGQLVEMLQKEALGKKVLKPGQRASAIYLVNQALGLPPQMTDVQFTGSMEMNDISDKPLSPDEWAAQADHMGTTAGTPGPTN